MKRFYVPVIWFVVTAFLANLSLGAVAALPSPQTSTAEPEVGKQLATGTPASEIAHSELVAGLAAQLRGAADSGSISGVVTASDTGAPLVGVQVQLYAGGMTNGTSTGESGEYSFSSLADGNEYRLEFNPPTGYLQEFYNNRPRLASADAVAIQNGAAVTGLDAAMDRGGHIAGRVVAEDSGAGLAYVTVLIYDDISAQVGWLNTDADGYYSTDDPGSPRPLRAGQYRLGFVTSPYSPSGPYVGEYYNNAGDLGSASQVAVLEGETTTLVDVRLQRTGQVTGKVTDDKGIGLQWVGVRVYEASSYGSYARAWASTDANGDYTTTQALPDGNYEVEFVPPPAYLAEFFDDKTSRETADPVFVTAGSMTPVNANVQRGAHLTGVVTASGTRANPSGIVALPGVKVSVYDSSGRKVAGGTSDGVGVYTTSPGLPGGRYRVGFSPPSTYTPEFYPNKPSLALADWLTLADGESLPLDAEMQLGGWITGHISEGDTGNKLIGARIEVYDGGGYSGYALATASSDANGNYTTPGLPSGNYRVGVFPSIAYLPGFYDGKSSLFTSDAVSVREGNPTLGVDIAPARGGQIIGTVTDGSDGTPVGGIRVRLYDAGGRVVATTNSGSDGRYFFTPGLPAGKYRVGVDTTVSLNRVYVPEFYDDKAVLDEGDWVTVNPGRITESIDVVLSKGGEVTGTVTRFEPPASPAGTWVYAYPADGYNSYATAWASADYNGNYRLVGLATNSYKVEFNRSLPGPSSNSSYPFLLEYYSNKGSLATADAVQVNAGGVTSGIDAVLSRGNRIVGTITDYNTGLPLKGTAVEVLAADGRVVTSTITDSGGWYGTSLGLPAGDYWLRVSPPSPYYPRYHPDATTQAAASPIAVVHGVDRNGIDFALRQGGQISGQVIGTNTGRGLPNAVVTVYDGGGNQVARTTADGRGIYTTPPLKEGSYYLHFSPGGISPYVPEYYGGGAQALSMTAAVTVNVTSGEVKGDINGSLSLGGQVSGTVTAGDSGFPIAGASVTLFDGGGSVVASGEVDTAGGYVTSPGVPSGDYRLLFSTNGQTAYLPEYYDNKPSLGVANVVRVDASSTTTSINAVLELDLTKRVYLPLVVRNP